MAYRVALRQPGLGPRAMAATLAGGLLAHLVLMTSLEAYLAGWIGDASLVAIQLVNPAIPVRLFAAICGLRERRDSR